MIGFHVVPTTLLESGTLSLKGKAQDSDRNDAKDRWHERELAARKGATTKNEVIQRAGDENAAMDRLKKSETVDLTYYLCKDAGDFFDP
jgi:hypothetical protein